MSGSWKISPHPVACRSQTQLLGAEAVQAGGSFYHVCPCLAWLPAFCNSNGMVASCKLLRLHRNVARMVVPVFDPSALWVLTHEILGPRSYLRRRSHQALQMLHPRHQSKQNVEVLNFRRFRTFPVAFLCLFFSPYNLYMT